MNPPTPGRALSLILLWSLFLIGPCFLVGALISAYSTQQFLRHSVTTQGSIVALKATHRARRRRITYAPVFRFQVPGSHFYTVVSNVSSSPPAFHPGESVTIHYDKDNPEHAVIDSFMQLWLGQLVFGCVGAVFTGISLMILVKSRKAKLASAMQSDAGSGITRL
ncbi:MAG: DUF3592 domain-containing protein [Terracidiphilus sp.]